jgi:hypothetical protein
MGMFETAKEGTELVSHRPGGRFQNLGGTELMRRSRVILDTTICGRHSAFSDAREINKTR